MDVCAYMQVGKCQCVCVHVCVGGVSAWVCMCVGVCMCKCEVSGWMICVVGVCVVCGCIGV